MEGEEVVQFEPTSQALAEFKAKRDEHLKMVNRAPNPKQIKTKTFGQKSNYIPIESLEAMLDSIYQEWSTEVKSTQVIANSVAVTIRLSVLDPVTMRYVHRDGVGAVAIQVDRGAAPTDFTAIKGDAIHKNLPAAKAFAFRNAVQSLGRRFGRNLNRGTDPEFYAMNDNKTLNG